MQTGQILLVTSTGELGKNQIPSSVYSPCVVLGNLYTRASQDLSVISYFLGAPCLPLKSGLGIKGLQGVMPQLPSQGLSDLTDYVRQHPIMDNFVRVLEIEHRPCACQVMLVDSGFLKIRVCGSLCVCHESTTCPKCLPVSEVLPSLLPTYLCPWR